MAFDIDKVAQIAQTISFSFEDQYYDIKKRELFRAIFNRYLLPIDPNGEFETYDAIIQLGRKEPAEFELMVKELKDKSLISG